MQEIDARAKKILHAVVSEYLATGEAVGSHTVTRRYGVDVSPATVRNVMGDLEELGLLRHAHVSGGRVPTDRGLRYYVDTLLRVRSLTAGEKDGIRERMGGATDVPELLHRTVRLLSELSHLAVVVQAPRPTSDVVNHLEFVRLRGGNVLAVITTASGQIQNKLFVVDFDLSASELELANNYLNELAEGLSLDQLRGRLVKEIAGERAQHDRLAKQALAMAVAAVPGEAPAAGVLVEGQSNLLAGHIVSDLERARALLRTLEDKDRIVRLLDRTIGAPGICVFIGAEANLSDLTDVSVVTSSYGSESRPLGTIGVIGPSRMNYSKVIPLVDFTAETITEAFGKRKEIEGT